MTKDEGLKLALEALEGVLDNSPKVLDASISGGLYEVVQCREAITAIKEALAQPEQDDRQLQIAMRQWDDWKTYALELEGEVIGYKQILDAQPERGSVAWEQFHEHLVERNFCPRCGKRTADLTTIHTCTPPQGNT